MYPLLPFWPSEGQRKMAGRAIQAVYASPLSERLLRLGAAIARPHAEGEVHRIIHVPRFHLGQESGRTTSTSSNSRRVHYPLGSAEIAPGGKTPWLSM